MRINPQRYIKWTRLPRFARWSREWDLFSVPQKPLAALIGFFGFTPYANKFATL